LSNDWLLFAAIAGAALASPAAGFFTIWVKGNAVLTSCVLGFASGVLLATISFEMLPSALENSGLWLAFASFAMGLAAVYGFDLFVHRGVLTGELADPRIRLRKVPRPLGDNVTVLAGGTSAEELLEGLTIGVGLAVEPKLGFIVALAVAIDNVSEALSIGELIRSDGSRSARAQARRILVWTSLIGVSLFISSLVGWLLLRNMQPQMLGVLFGLGAGGMFYLTLTELVPEAERRQYQQFPALAMAAGFLLILGLSTVR
jgi:ZIP family zinc transporter